MAALFAILLFLAPPSFARLYIDYTQSPTAARPVPNAAALVSPGAAEQARSAGYGPRDVAVRLAVRILPSSDTKALSKALREISPRSRYSVAVDLRGLSSTLRSSVKGNIPAAARLARIRSYFFIEDSPLSLEDDTRNSQLFQLASRIFNGEDIILDAASAQMPLAQEVLRRILDPRKKPELLSWDQGHFFLFTDGFLVDNPGTLGIFSLPKDLVRTKGDFSVKNMQGSVLWEEEGIYKALMMPSSAAFWRIQ